jgi:predicted CopG family antitoxin
LTKIILITDKVYNYLTSIKNESESFTQLFKRLTEKKKASEFIKLEGTIKDEDFKLPSRKSFKSREIRFD